MKINTRTKALLLCCAGFALCTFLAVRFLSADRIVVIGGADGPTAVFMAGSRSPGEKQALQLAQLQTRLQETLCQLEGVESAAVVLSPANSAEVSLRLFSGATLSEQQCDTVKKLVCNATGFPQEDIFLSITAP